MATSLNVEPGMWPKDRKEFDRYFWDMVEKLEVTDEARGVAKDLIDQTGVPFGVFWVYATVKGPVSRVMTTEILPEKVRKGFGLESTVYSRGVYRLVNGLNSWVVPWVPSGVRAWPKNYYMRDLRSRIAAGAKL